MSGTTSPSVAGTAPAPWPGQLRGAVPGTTPATLAKGAVLQVDTASLKKYSRAQVEQAWVQLRTMLGPASTSPHLLDPSKPITASDVAAVSGLNFSPRSREGLGHLVPAALGGDPAAVNALLPLFYWQGSGQSAASQLRLGARPVAAFTITEAKAGEVAAQGRHAIAVSVSSELELSLVDATGAANKLTLLRQVTVALVPREASEPSHAPAWQIDGWNGSWQQLKPPGQRLPDAAEGASEFQPTTGTTTGTTAGTAPAPPSLPARPGP